MSGNYPEDWNLIARQVKEAADWHCIRCGHHNDVTTGHVLTVHHWDMDKSNCRWWNLLPLCQRCHLAIQARVDPNQPYFLEHTDWLKLYAAGFYAWKYLGEEITKADAVARMDELLALERLI